MEEYGVDILNQLKPAMEEAEKRSKRVLAELSALKKQLAAKKNPGRGPGW